MGQILTINNIQETIKTISDPIILVGGCFDMLHPGHIAFLSSAKKIGGTVIVLLESDEKIRTLKGDSRPIHTQSDRAIILSALSDVDYVIPLPHFTQDHEYEQIVYSIHPSYFAITTDDPVKSFVNRYAKTLNAQVIEVTNRIVEFSSTKIINQLNT